MYLIIKISLVFFFKFYLFLNKIFFNLFYEKYGVITSYIGTLRWIFQSKR